MSIIEDREEYLKNPFFKKHEYSDFSPFYVTITICTIIGVSLFILNIVCGCCSKYSEYWNDRFTGNRWIVSLWTATPHKQPSLDYTELEKGTAAVPRVPNPTTPQEYFELQKRESEI